MEEFKTLKELTMMDEKHHLMGLVCGGVPSLELMHKLLSKASLNDAVPDVLRGQFNVVRNMALYTFYFYALAPKVQLKSYVLVEQALRLRLKPTKRMMLSKLLHSALEQGLISDSGFRHVKNPTPNNKWCKKMLIEMPRLRNDQAHGSSYLAPDCLHHVAVCADFINQLYPDLSAK